MGQDESVPANLKMKMNRNYFDFQYVIGKGGFGKVWKVVYKKNQRIYAWKEMLKVKIIDRKSEKSIWGERDFLSKLHHPFIVNMVYAFQDYENLYLVMDYLTGGDLRYHICKKRMFNETQTKFFIACLWLGWEYIHANNIIHRDWKPENWVCDDKGYIRITDFGVAKIRHADNSSETSGTPGYMAPEVWCAQNHSFPVDFFAIGVMGYEFMLGERPYKGRNRKEIKQVVLQKQAMVKDEMLPDDWSKESQNFINQCLKRKEFKRWGYNGGVKELMEHPWFQDMDWDRLASKTLPSPFHIKGETNYDKKYCESIDKLNPETIERYQSYMGKDNFVSIFFNYTFGNKRTFDTNNVTNSDLVNVNTNNNVTRPSKWTTNTTCTLYNYDKPSPKTHHWKVKKSCQDTIDWNNYGISLNHYKRSDKDNKIITNIYRKVGVHNIPHGEGRQIFSNEYNWNLNNNQNIRLKPLSKNYSFLNRDALWQDTLNLNCNRESRNYSNLPGNWNNHNMDNRSYNNNNFVNTKFPNSSGRWNWYDWSQNMGSFRNWAGSQSYKNWNNYDNPVLLTNKSNGILPWINTNTRNSINNPLSYPQISNTSMKKIGNIWPLNKTRTPVNPWINSWSGVNYNGISNNNNINININNDNDHNKIYIKKRSFSNGRNKSASKKNSHKSVNNNNHNN